MLLVENDSDDADGQQEVNEGVERPLGPEEADRQGEEDGGAEPQDEFGS